MASGRRTDRPFAAFSVMSSRLVIVIGPHRAGVAGLRGCHLVELHIAHQAETAFP